MTSHNSKLIHVNSYCRGAGVNHNRSTIWDKRNLTSLIDEQWIYSLDAAYSPDVRFALL